MAKNNYGYMYVLSKDLDPRGFVLGGRHYGFGYTKKSAGEFLDLAIENMNEKERYLYRDDPRNRYRPYTRKDFTIVRVSRDYLNQLHDMTYNQGKMYIPRYSPFKKVRGMWTLE